MAFCNSRATISYILELTSDEASWLRGLVQNPMCPANEEPDSERAMRRQIFDALDGVDEIKHKARSVFGEVE